MSLLLSWSKKLLFIPLGIYAQHIIMGAEKSILMWLFKQFFRIIGARENKNKENTMDILDQKLGSVGEVHISIVAGKLVIAVEGDLDLVAQLEKLHAAHKDGLLGAALMAAEDGLKALTAPKEAAPQA